jgi:Protein of unknown function (DUF3037)
MTTGKPYTYTALRYIHDVITGEFVNVGVVVHCPDARYLGAKLRRTHGRLSATFPNLDGTAFRSSMRLLERAFKGLAVTYQNDDLFRAESDAAAVARSVLPADDSSLQWSPLGGGVTTNPEQQLHRLYDRLVSRYDEKQEHRRTDEDIWRSVRDKLEAAKLAAKLTKKIIRGAVDELEFKHAWKNGVWHCYEGLSFDLADADGIKNKARRWTGHLAAVSDAADPFKPYFIVGAPSDSRLMAAYEDALAILTKSPIEPEVLTETQTMISWHRLRRRCRLFPPANRCLASIGSREGTAGHHRSESHFAAPRLARGRVHRRQPAVHRRQGHQGGPRPRCGLSAGHKMSAGNARMRRENARALLIARGALFQAVRSG